MGAGDRERWDRIWRDAGHGDGASPDWLDSFGDALPHRGLALDVASGAGRVALWLAARGLETLAVDVSPEGLRRASDAAARAGLALETRALDLETEPVPEGPFAAIAVFHYLQRDLFPRLAERLAPGGVLACEIATVRNLERHASPSKRFLVEPDELPRLCAPLETVGYREGWIGDSHLARILARRPSPG
jgi:SAM-dependent methyltransferase